MNALRSLMVGIIMLVVVLISVPVTALAAFSNAVDPDLVGLWRMDGDWKDASVVGNDMMPLNGVIFSPNAKVGTNSVIFDGIDDYLIGKPFKTFPETEMSAEFWINTSDSSKTAGILSYATSNSDNEFLIYNQNNLSIYRGAFLLTTGVSVNDGNWHHVVVTWLSSNGLTKLFKDGVLAYSAILAANTLIQDGGSLVLGGEQDSVGGSFEAYQRYIGLLDEVAIYNRALSDIEVQQHYRNNVVKSPTVNPVPSPTISAGITLSGSKPANTAIVVNGNTLVPLDATTNWQATYTLSPGTNNLNITTLNSQNLNSLPVTLSVVLLDTTPPAAPTIDPVTVPINATSKTITGTKSSDSATVAVGCTGATIGTLSYPTATSWSAIISGLQEGSNTITAYAADTAGNPSATITATITVDTTPPSVGATPAGGIYISAQIATLAANEPAAIYYTVDGSIPTTSATTYSRPIAIPAGATLKYFARDLAGNSSEIKTENYVIDTTPPTLAISTLSDAAYTNNETLNIAGMVTDNTSISAVTVNDTTVQVNTDGSFSYALLLKNGVNIITIVATDSVGNRAADTRTVTLDQTAPVLAVTTPADNSKTGKMLLEVSGTVDETSTVTVKLKDILQSVLMNGGAFTSTVILEPGYNTIEIAAADLAGNRSTLKRTVIFDDQVPSLAVTVPSQDIRTNQRSLTIKGTVSDDLTEVGVTISKDNEIFTPLVIEGTFEQSVNFAEEKTYGIVVTAINEVGTSTSVQRNVIYDITPPVLSIDPVPTPTSQPSLSISGTREDGTEVTVTCATATVGEISYPTATTWLVDITGLREGENVINAASADAAGNVITSTVTVVLVSRLPEITIKATPDVIWPPNRKMVPVTITGGVTGSDVKSVSISVSDEYGKCEYKNLTFGSTVKLEARRDGNDRDGRKYTITVIVTNKGGIKTAKTATVTVPHDESKIKKSFNGSALKKKKLLTTNVVGKLKND